MFDDRNPIPAPLRDLLSVFAEQLQEIRFGDLDQATLQEAAAHVVALADKAAVAEAALEAARADLAAAQQTLCGIGNRALAYAKIYAETSPDLLFRLQTISISNGSGDVGKAREVESKLARRRSRKEAVEEMPALPGTTVEGPLELTSASGAA